MPGEDGSLADTTPGMGPSSGGNENLEPLACVTCRSRKLKCDRVKPACTRCVKLKADCVYPESRRKPSVKRRHVKELEHRLAQVEVLLKDAVGQTTATVPETTKQQSPSQDQGAHLHGPQSNAHIASRPDSTFHTSIDTSFENGALNSLNWGFSEGLSDSCVNGITPDSDGPEPHAEPVPPGWGSIYALPSEANKPRAENAGATSYELLGLGLFESLPPPEMIEELHRTFFIKQHPLIPVVHPGRYIQAFYSAPHLRPPMALQYAIWTMATNGHEKYSSYHDAFHRRCRHYLQEDESRGDGEHFLTVSHAQAWALIATDEARCMWYTRAAMSASRCIKLLHMMGLHRLDDPNAEFEMAPTIAPPKDWTELEERRRVFWGAFAIDSHAAISTGWPTLIDLGDVTTHLPSTEEAFNLGREETTCQLQDVFTGSSYSSFAGVAVICHLFNQIMRHVHRKRSNDAPENYEYGRYWTRHRELDNLLSSAFMYLPDRLRLPQNLRDPMAINTNLNLHASLICLHNSAFERALENNLSDQIKQMTKTRLFTAAQEIVNIVKLSSHMNTRYRSPLVSLALYVASSVYASQAQDEGLSPSNTTNLEFLLTAMEAIGKQHRITLSFLGQAIFDIQRAGLQGVVRVPNFDVQSDGGKFDMSSCGHNIPLFARSRISKGFRISPPLPGRLPLNKPFGRRRPPPMGMSGTGTAAELNQWDATSKQQPQQPQQPVAGGGGDGSAQEPGKTNKRRRVNLSPDLASVSEELNSGPLHWFSPGTVEEVSSSTDNTPGTSSMSSSSRSRGLAAQPLKAAASDGINRFRLPHRGGTSTSSSSPSAAMNSSSTPTSSGLSPGQAAATIGARNSVTEGEIMLTDQAVSAELFGTMSDAAAAAATPAAGVVNQNSGVDPSLFQGINSWDTAGGGGGAQDASALYVMSDDSWSILNDVGTRSSSWDTGPEGGASQVLGKTHSPVDSYSHHT